MPHQIPCTTAPLSRLSPPRLAKCVTSSMRARCRDPRDLGSERVLREQHVSVIDDGLLGGTKVTTRMARSLNFFEQNRTRTDSWQSSNSWAENTPLPQCLDTYWLNLDIFVTLVFVYEYLNFQHTIYSTYDKFIYILCWSFKYSSILRIFKARKNWTLVERLFINLGRTVMFDNVNACAG